MSAPAKFLFDLDFAAPAKPAAAAEEERTVALAEHEAALKAAEARGYQKGVTAAEVQARTQAERQTAAAFERIAGSLAVLANELPALSKRIETQSVEVATAVGRKLAPALIETQPFAEIAALVEGCFRELIGTPHVVVRVGEGLYELARERLGDIARARGFDGRLVVLGEAEIAPGDCRIEWADGGIVRDHAAVEAAIADAVARWIAERTGEPA
ncbi:FlbE protein [Rhodovulum sp. PH10]|uniref:FliH/SctL family protein n=1 Tax=Rhodovulum sp. PH10 TaxID=1187851 RepID=UPI00027C2182|nr:FliH/SctL family protein [Rhodovulum sp. PH10]EJW13179.1 FlbE protein [Rhodovulum sp. PH10]